MAIETQIEKKLIEQLSMGDSQWTNRPDLRTEDDLWKNFRAILESNNQDKLNGTPLSDTEFERIKYQVVSSSFYDAGQKLQGENGTFIVKIERDSKPVILKVFDRRMKTGGSSVYEIINQFSAFGDKENGITDKDRRFDISFLFNGIPLIHMELKNGRNASYIEAFNQIQKYIREGHFKGIFSLVQMFVVSNEVNTKYIAASSNMQPQFLTSWTDENDPDKTIPNLFDFSHKVLRIPEAHEIITDYCQLDASKKELILLRPYQIQAIKAIRKAYMEQKSGYIWHTTGSGKTITSYKASRNMLFDIPNLDKTLFLIDRRDLDDKTNRDFKSYADNDSIAFSGTEDVSDLLKKLKAEKREMIVTTRQKLQTLIRKCINHEIKEKDIETISKKHIAFVVDECHRTITKETQTELNRFFRYHMWYGFTGTPIFVETIGSKSATTQQLFGEVLHKYTIKNALHDKSVLGFQVERIGAKGIKDDGDVIDENEDLSVYETEKHMLNVIDIIVNKCAEKFGLNNGPGKTFEAILTVGTIKRAQKYYELFMKVKRGETDVKIRKDILERYPDFPRVAVTYSLAENKDGDEANKDKMRASIKDYNKMFEKNYVVENINDYNDDLTERFTRKSFSSISRTEQLDLVIVAERLLTGFDAPTLSTVFIDRQPMAYHNLIQAFSRTNRLYDGNKTTGYIMTFQSPGAFKIAIDNAIELYSLGGTNEVITPSFEEMDIQLRDAVRKLRNIVPTPADCADLSPVVDKMKLFCFAFQRLDSTLSKIRGYIEWDSNSIESYGITQKEFWDYEAWYRNTMDELRKSKPDDGSTGDGGGKPGPEPDVDYVLQSYGKDIIDYTYVLRLIQAHTKEVSEGEDMLKRKEKEDEIDKLVATILIQCPKIGEQLQILWDMVKEDPVKYKDEDITVLFETMKEKAVEEALKKTTDELCLDYDTVKFSSEQYSSLHEDDIPYFSQIQKTSNPRAYCEKENINLPPYKYYTLVKDKLGEVFKEDVLPFKDENLF